LCSVELSTERGALVWAGKEEGACAGSGPCSQQRRVAAQVHRSPRSAGVRRNGVPISRNATHKAITHSPTCFPQAHTRHLEALSASRRSLEKNRQDLVRLRWIREDALHLNDPLPEPTSPAATLAKLQSCPPGLTPPIPARAQVHSRPVYVRRVCRVLHWKLTFQRVRSWWI
jgi:hypothetical protein